MFDLTKLRDLLPDEISMAYRTQLKEAELYYTKLEKAFTSDFMDDFWTEIGKLTSIEVNQAFIEGLHLGAQLTLALLLPQ